MKKHLYTGIIFLFFNLTGQSQAFVAPLNNDRDRLFDAGWLFKKGDISGADAPTFDDGKWRRLDLPHDWSIEDITDSSILAKADPVKDTIAGPFWNNSIGSVYTGFTVGGTAWYRKHFVLDKNDDHKKVSIYFDGVYRDAQVYINGHYLGEHPYGYTAFYYDLTPYLNKAGADNIMAVKVNNEGISSRWYSGSGIYRHVWLTVTNPIYLDRWGITIKTNNVSTGNADVHISSRVIGDNIPGDHLKVKISLFTPSGKIVATETKDILVIVTDSVTTSRAGVTDQILPVKDPELWDVDHPNLYKAVVEVIRDDRTEDKITVDFGIRTLSFSTKKGFLLNGKMVKLKGGCMHHDNGILGSVALDRADIRRIELMKASGYNAVRCSHNPPSVQFLNACDRLGFLVLDEAFDTWNVAKTPQDYSVYFKDHWKDDIRTLIMRDRNHPSVIMWSIGNEIPEKADSIGLATEKLLYDEIKQYDTTRPVTEGINILMKPDKRPRSAEDPAWAMLDVKGYNYMCNYYEGDFKEHPDRIIVGTESFPMKVMDNWRIIDKHPYAIGDFVWAGMDYLGESGVGRIYYDGESAKLHFPYYEANCGDIDLIGQKKPQSYYRDVVWNRRDIVMMVHAPVPKDKKEVISHWGWPNEFQSWSWAGQEGKNMDINVYTKLPTVRIELNGGSFQANKATDSKTYTASFSVPYAAGEIKAVGIDSNGRDVAYTILRTTGTPYALRMRADRNEIFNDRNDLCYVTIEVVDKNGNVIPDGKARVSLTLEGAGHLESIGNADPIDIKSFKQNNTDAWQGWCLAIIRPNGKSGIIHISVSAPGLQGADMELKIMDK